MTDTKERTQTLEERLSRAADQIGRLTLRNRTTGNIRAILANVGDDIRREIIDPICEPEREEIERLSNALELTDGLLVQARDLATDDLAALAETAEAAVDAHIATLNAYRARHVDRYVMNRADQRERGKR